MNVVYLLVLLIGGYALFSLRRKQSKRIEMLKETSKQFHHTRFVENSAVDIEALSEVTTNKRVMRSIRNHLDALGHFAVAKVIGFYLITLVGGWYFNATVLKLHPVVAILGVLLLATWMGIKWLEQWTEKQFEQAFPDALNMISSSVSAGESLMHGIIFVGQSLDNVVGHEFKKMGERLQICESPDEVFKKSCQRFPYQTFLFFVIALRANISRGGQLKEVISRLNRVLFDARTVEKKKFSMTAEARMSAKIVCAIPFIFLFGIMQFLSPENFEFVMNDPQGRQILFYVLLSEAFGIGIVIMLMRSVR